MSKKKPPKTPGKTLSEEDEELWDKVSKTVVPLREENDKAPERRRRETPQKRQPGRRVDTPPLPVATTSHSISDNHDISRRIRRRQLTIEGTLDLHGMTLDEAWHTLFRYLENAYRAKMRCLLIITGKGKKGEGRLRQQVPLWLEEHPIKDKIIGYSTSRQEDGGTGALYVLFKRQRQDK